MPPAPHRLFASIVLAGAAIGGGASCVASHDGDDAGTPFPDAPVVADAGHDAPAVSDTPSDVPRLADASDTGADTCPTDCAPCDERAECAICLPCII